ncbi:hypothetical protein [Aquimarina atlantica]|uniref:hypothetical protein n=1 Tax=Aquimarina atlantica TaxID=1317122 RepID=UPI000AA12034|nr:hypothetical protein [Aquimarina atlantica]
MSRLSLGAFKAKVKNNKQINLKTIIGGNSDSCHDERESKKSRGITMTSGDMS